MSAACPRRARARMQPSWMSRPNTWAMGRNSSVDEPGARKTSLSATTTLSTSNMRLPWVSMQPFGRPVVPEV